MNNVGIRVANRAGPQVFGSVDSKGRSESPARRSNWPFTVQVKSRTSDSPVACDAKPSRSFTT
jgi:hypothetical protein